MCVPWSSDSIYERFWIPCHVNTKCSNSKVLVSAYVSCITVSHFPWTILAGSTASKFHHQEQPGVAMEHLYALSDIRMPEFEVIQQVTEVQKGCRFNMNQNDLTCLVPEIWLAKHNSLRAFENQRGTALLPWKLNLETSWTVNSQDRYVQLQVSHRTTSPIKRYSR